jgi:hypothetical protein
MMCPQQLSSRLHPCLQVLPLWPARSHGARLHKLCPGTNLRQVRLLWTHSRPLPKRCELPRYTVRPGSKALLTERVDMRSSLDQVNDSPRSPEHQCVSWAVVVAAVQSRSMVCVAAPVCVACTHPLLVHAEKHLARRRCTICAWVDGQRCAGWGQRMLPVATLLLRNALA